MVDVSVNDGDAIDVTVTGGAGTSDEHLEDVVGALLSGGNGVTATYDDGAGTLTVDIDTDAIQADELDLSISPTWTGNHTFSGSTSIEALDNVADHIVGTDDDLADIVNNEASANEVVWVGPGTHGIDTRLDLKDGMVIRGAGEKTVIRKAAAVTTIRADGVDDWVLRDLTLDGNESSITGQTSIANLTITGDSSNWRVENVTSKDVWEPNAAGGGNHSFSVRAPASGAAPSDGVFVGCRAINYGDDGFSITANTSNSANPPNAIEITDFLVDGSGTSNSTTHKGIELENGVQDILVSNGRILGTYSTAISVEASDSGAVANQNIDISDIVINQATAQAGGRAEGVRINNTQEPSVDSQVNVSDVVVQNAEGLGGFVVVNISGWIASGLNIHTDSARGISISGTGTEDGTIDNTHIEGNTSNDAVRIDDATDITLDSVTAKGAQRGFLVASSASDVNFVGACKAKNCSSIGFLLSGANITVSNGRSTSNGSHGYSITAADATLEACRGVDNDDRCFNLDGANPELIGCEARDTRGTPAQTGLYIQPDASGGRITSMRLSGNDTTITEFNDVSDFIYQDVDNVTLADVNEGNRVDGVVQESGTADTPTGTNADPGTLVEYDDTDDGTGDGIWLKQADGTMIQLA